LKYGFTGFSYKVPLFFCRNLAICLPNFHLLKVDFFNVIFCLLIWVRLVVFLFSSWILSKQIFLLANRDKPPAHPDKPPQQKPIKPMTQTDETEWDNLNRGLLRMGDFHPNFDPIRPMSTPSSWYRSGVWIIKSIDKVMNTKDILIVHGEVDRSTDLS
jgi:hypothetical protein